MPDGRSKHSTTRTTRSGRPAGQARTVRRRADAPGTNRTNNEVEYVSPEDAERIRRSNRAGDTDDLTLPDFRQRGREGEDR
jgi:hypothetical protein